MSDATWKLIFGAVTAVCVFILAQPDVPLEPIAKVVLGAIVVALSVINPNRTSVSGGTQTN